MNTNSNTNDYALKEIQTPRVFYPFILLIFFLIIMLFFTMFKVNTNIEKNVFIVLFFSLLVVGICITLIPNFGSIRNLFEQIGNVVYLIVYVIGLILLLLMTPDETLNKYAYIITPAAIILGAFLFYISSAENYVVKFDVNYERIKTMILFFCFITTFILLYNVDPGGYIKKYLGFSVLLTIIISVFVFLYLMIILTLPDKSKLSSKQTNFLNNFTGFSAYGSIAFVVFIIVMVILVYTHQVDLFKNKTKIGASSIILLVICILWGILLIANVFPESFDKTKANNTVNLFKRSLLILFGIIILGLIIFWFIYNIQHLSSSSSSSIVSFVLNLLLLIIILGFIYKTIFVKLPQGNANKNAFFTLLLNTIFYIPCLFTGAAEKMSNTIPIEQKPTPTSAIIAFVIAILLFVVYFKGHSLFNLLNIQGGKQLVNQPVYTNSQYSLGTYAELNGSDIFDYQYAISFWVFLDATAPNMNASYSKYTSLLNFGEKPNVLYNGKTNTLMITMQQKGFQNKLIDFDENGNRILYKNENMLLQKWNNIIINYSGGILDIFLNGELVKSDVGVVPYYSLDNLTIGSEDGIQGGICNVVYFNKSLTSANVYYLYNMVKNKSPPVLNESNETILKQNIASTTSAINTVNV
jgi:hypothetical protein